LRNHFPQIPLPLFAAQEHVGRDRQRRRQGKILVDRFNAGVARLHRGAEMHGLTVQQDLARIGITAPPGP
jgi:hypothetical protein